MNNDNTTIVVALVTLFVLIVPCLILCMLSN